MSDWQPPPRPDPSPFDPKSSEPIQTARSRARVRWLLDMIDEFQARGLTPTQATETAVAWMNKPVAKEDLLAFGEEER